MKKPQPDQKPFAPLMVLVGPVAAFFLYAMLLGHPIDAPDLDFISDDVGASAIYPLDQVWLAPTPPERPDLAMYRPVHATFLKLNYALWPAKINLFRMSGLFLFIAATLFFSLLVVRILEDDLARAAAMLMFACHPMMTEPNAWLSAQGVLIALAAWMAALWIYHVHLTGKLPLAATAGAMGLLYFLALGSYEAALLMPLSIVAMDFFASPDTSEASLASARIKRATYVGAPIAGITLIYLVMRAVALNTTFFPDATVRGLGDASILSRLASAPSALAMGVLKLFLPLTQSFIYDPVYGAGTLPIWLALPLLVGIALVLLAAVIQSRTAALGLALALVPLLALIQVFPLTIFFAERLLLLAVPGLAIAFGDLLGRWTPLAGPSSLSPQRAKFVRIAAGVVLVLLATLTLMRNHTWGKNAAHWAAEAGNNPSSPEPLTLQLMAIISQPEVGLDSTTIRRVSEDALRLAKGADADPIYQYLALYYLQVGNGPAMRTLIETALKSDRPTRYGVFNGLAVVATAFGFSELAEQAMLREHERWPNDFNNLFSLAQAAASRGDWQKSLEYAIAAMDNAPSHMDVLARVRFGDAAVNVPGREVEGLEALTRATQLLPQLAEPYLLLARYYDKSGDIAKMELTLQAAMASARVDSFAELAAIQAESYERAGRLQDAGQFLINVASARNSDIPLQLYTGRFLLDHKFYNAAEKFYRTVLSQAQNHPTGIYGLARIAAERDGRYDVAVNALRALLQADPGNNEAATLLAQIESRMATQAAEPSPGTSSPVEAPPALAPIPIN